MYIDENTTDLMLKVQTECEYPGHTMMVAFAIVLNFESFQEASSKGNEFKKAHESQKVPGAGCAVTKAMKAIEYGIQNDLDGIAMADHCKEAWKEYAGHQDAYADKVEEGNERANPYIQDFVSYWNEWKK